MFILYLNDSAAISRRSRSEIRRRGTTTSISLPTPFHERTDDIEFNQKKKADSSPGDQYRGPLNVSTSARLGMARRVGRLTLLVTFRSIFLASSISASDTCPEFRTR